MVHDIKNVIAQLTLVTSNFEKFKGNPDFVSDAMETIEHAANKMKLLIGYLGKDLVIHAASPQKFDLAALLEEIINQRKNSKPEPVLRQSISGIIINSEKDKLASALEHLVQNAQDATSEKGNVWLALKQQDGEARITIGDDGCGMDEVFIKTRLFKPFDTTKGNAGMGIGVYESREIIHSMGGSIQVESHSGEGTVFTISIPCHIEENEMKANNIGLNS
jgi:putative PEP-CTERM system histidine kinase